MNNVNTLWTEKYRPQSLNDYYISKINLDIISKWITDLQHNKYIITDNRTNECKPFLILNGSSGIGKTTLAYLILQQYNYEIIECNASDTRSKKQIQDVLGGITKVSVCVDDNNIFKKSALILDEIDGLNGACESSGVQEIIDIVITKKNIVNQ